MAVTYYDPSSFFFLLLLYFAEWWLPAPMFAVADGKLQGKQELIHNGFFLFDRDEDI